MQWLERYTFSQFKKQGGVYYALPTSVFTNSFSQGFPYVSGTEFWRNIDDPVGQPDGDSSYVQARWSNGAMFWRFDPVQIKQAGKYVVSIIAYARTVSGSVSLAMGIRINGVLYSSFVSNLTSSYVYYKLEYPLNPATGNNWTKSEIENDLTDGYISLINITRPEIGRITSSYMEIKW